MFGFLRYNSYLTAVLHDWNIMKKLLLIIFLTTTIYAEDQDMQQIFFDFESAYMSNETTQFKPWLTENYSLTQTLHIPEVGSETNNVSRKVLLQTMNLMELPNTMPRSTLENIVIETLKENKFCGLSKTKNRILVTGKMYNELETRKVCFEKINSSYLAYSHEINVHYSDK